MMRAGFLALGLALILSGTALVFVEDVAFNKRVSADASLVLNLVGNSDESGRIHLQPPEWMPFTFLGVGFVTLLYFVALPRE